MKEFAISCIKKSKVILTDQSEMITAIRDSQIYPMHTLEVGDVVVQIGNYYCKNTDEQTIKSLKFIRDFINNPC